MDKRAPRDGRVIEELGWFDPLAPEDKQLSLKPDRIDYWLSVGAQPSRTVKTLLKRVDIDPTSWQRNWVNDIGPTYADRHSSHSFQRCLKQHLQQVSSNEHRIAGHVEIHVHDIRNWADNKHRKVDDRPYGGGPGMVMMCQPLHDAVQEVERQLNSSTRSNSLHATRRSLETRTRRTTGRRKEFASYRRSLRRDRRTSYRNARPPRTEHRRLRAQWRRNPCPASC